MEDARHIPPESDLSFNEYQDWTDTTAIYARPQTNFVYPAMKLAGEAGEVIEEIGKMLRPEENYNDIPWDEIDRKRIGKELGDVLWYIARVARAFNLTMAEVVALNLEKLNNRKSQGTLHGRGSDR